MHRIAEEAIFLVENKLQYKFQDVNNLIVALTTKPAYFMYTSFPSRAYLPLKYIEKLQKKQDALATVGDAIISAVVCVHNFVNNEACTKQSMR